MVWPFPFGFAKPSMPDRIVTIARVSTSIPLLSRADISGCRLPLLKKFSGACSTAVHFAPCKSRLARCPAELVYCLMLTASHNTHSVNLRRCRLDIPNTASPIRGPEAALGRSALTFLTCHPLIGPGAQRLPGNGVILTLWTTPSWRDGSK